MKYSVSPCNSLVLEAFRACVRIGCDELPSKARTMFLICSKQKLLGAISPDDIIEGYKTIDKVQKNALLYCEPNWGYTREEENIITDALDKIGNKLYPPWKRPI